MKESTRLTKSDLIPFEAFVGFNRLKKVNPILACEPPEWAAAAHAMVVDGPYTTCGLDGNKATNWILITVRLPWGRPLSDQTRPEEPCPVAFEGRF